MDVDLADDLGASSKHEPQRSGTQLFAKKLAYCTFEHVQSLHMLRGICARSSASPL